MLALHTKTHKMVTKTQFSSKSHHNIALVLLNNTHQQIKSWSPPTTPQWQKVDNKQSSHWRWLIPLGRAKHLTPPPPLYAWYLLGPRWGGAQDNEPYGGICIKTQKSKYEKIRIFNAWSIEKCATLHLNDSKKLILDSWHVISLRLIQQKKKIGFTEFKTWRDTINTTPDGGFELYLGLIHVSCVTSHFSSSQRVQLRIWIILNVLVPYLLCC